MKKQKFKTGDWVFDPNKMPTPRQIIGFSEGAQYIYFTTSDKENIGHRIADFDFKKAKPIIFSTPMVKAIDGDSKTQTRRLLSNSLIYNGLPDTYKFDGKDDIGRFCFGDLRIESPYQVGNILYVRETWAEVDGKFVYKSKVCSPDHDKPASGWKPSIHMPARAARLFLKVEEVRIERLQGINEADAIAEGLKFVTDVWTVGGTPFCEHASESPIQTFKSLWNSINESRSPWAANPWVWVVGFSKIKNRTIVAIDNSSS